MTVAAEWRRWGLGLKSSGLKIEAVFRARGQVLSDQGQGRRVAVLVSGGVDSAALAVELARGSEWVAPIFVRFGLRWEAAELAGLRAFFQAVADPRLAPLTVLDEAVADVYGADHWSIGGPTVPGLDSTDDAVYLPGRNLLLVVKAAVWCRLRAIEWLALGSLAGNPFPDSSDPFFEHLAAVLNLGMVGHLKIIRPFATLTKADVLRRAPDLPWHLTFSCLNPDEAGRHCGACNKCSERIRAFAQAGMTDPTRYALARSSAP